MLEKGTILAGYRIDGVLGQGGMGVVYEATQLSLARKVALKLLAGHLSDDITFRERFRREGLIQAQIDHPHIVTVHEAGETEHGLFLAMRLIRGPNLKDVISSGDLDAHRALRILRPIAEAIDAAHDAGLTHRDIKPQNILVGARDHAYLADFGLTKGRDERSLTKTGQFVGTLDYISPEQIQGLTASGKSDLYSFAAVLYECLTGDVPYPRDSDVAVLYAHVTDPPPRVTAACPELPAALDAVIEQAMAKDPAERPDSAAALIAEAERALGGSPIAAPRAARGPGSPPRELSEDEGAIATRAPAPRQRAPGAATAEATPPEGHPELTDAEPHATRPAHTRRRPRAPQPQPAAGPAPTKAAPHAPARPRARARSWLLGIGVVVLGTAGVVGFLAGSSGTEKGAAVGSSFASSGGLELNFPDNWRRTESPIEIPGLDFRSPMSLAPPGGGDNVGLVAGQVRATGPTLLPRTFRERLPPSGRRGRVRIGDLEAYRYRNLRPRGFDGRVTLYTVPNSDGVATVACALPRTGGAKAAADCDQAAESLNLTDAQSFPVGPDEDYAKVLDKTIGTLNERRVSLRGRLEQAETPQGQANISADLAASYEAAARRLARQSVSPAVQDVHESILEALRGTASAYTQMARAAGDGARGRYGEAADAVSRRERSVRRGLDRLKPFGYERS